MSLFVTFEGPDGCGKSTQIARLAECLRAEGYDVVATREPGGTAIGDQVREVLHTPRNRSMRPVTELLLYCASRAQLVDEVIRPHLDRGGVVLSDRYVDSSLAYQGYGRGLDLDRLRAILDFATGGLRPDLTLLLDIEVEEGLRRRKGSGGEWNRLDQETIGFHRRAREGYLSLAQAEPDRWVIVDAARSVEDVQADIRAEVVKRLAVQRRRIV
ncbi:MAG: dTMP kinase [Anaerolineae bacterium]